MVDVIRTLWTGDVVEHYGAHYDLPPLEMQPVPSDSVPVWVGGTSDVSLRRAARHDGRISDLHTTDELTAIRAPHRGLPPRGRPRRAALRDGRHEHEDAGLEGYWRMADGGVTHLMTWPWVFYAGLDATPQQKRDGSRRFADDVISRS